MARTERKEADPTKVFSKAEVVDWIVAHPGTKATAAAAHFASLLTTKPSPTHMHNFRCRIRVWMHRDEANGIIIREESDTVGAKQVKSQGRPRTKRLDRDDLHVLPPPEREPSSGEPDIAAMSAIEAAKYAARLAQAFVAGSSPGTPGFASAMKTMLDAHAEVKRLQEEAKEKEQPPEEIPEEEWRARLEEDAATCSDADLEPYVAEWLRRIRHTITTDANGNMVLSRMGA